MRRHLTVTRICPIPYDDFQSFLSVFTQISPTVETFGWNIFVANQPEGKRSTLRSNEGVMTGFLRTFWWGGRELLGEVEPNPKVATRIGRALYSTTRQPRVRRCPVVHNHAPGPWTIPVTSNMLSSLTTTRIPSGGFVRSSFSSRIKRRRTAGAGVYAHGAISQAEQPNTLAQHIPWMQTREEAWLRTS